MSTLMISNPRRRKSRRRRARAMTPAQAKYFGPRRKSRRRRSRRSSSPRTLVRYSAAPRAARRSRRRGGGGLIPSGGGLIRTTKAVAIQGSAAAAGLIGTQMVLDRIPYVKDLSGNKRIAAKVALAALVATFGRRFVPMGLAPAIATGIAAGAAMDLYTNYMASRNNVVGPPALSGGIASPGGINYRYLNRRVVVNN